MLHRFAAPLISLLLLTPAVMAQEADTPDPAATAQINALFQALALPEMVEIMAEEGTEYGLQIAQDLIPAGITADWTRTVATIYDTTRMEAQAHADFHVALTGVDVAPMLAFFETEPGRTIIELEVSARRALLDDAVEEASKEVAAIAIADQTERFALIEEFARVNDLIETNIVGALNSNFAFYTGLASGGAFDATLTEDQILSDVWSQEPQIRENTTEWVYSFLLMAYQPLPDADVQSYIDFSETEAGKALNKAVFSAFDDMFEDISRALGTAAAEAMLTQEL